MRLSIVSVLFLSTGLMLAGGTASGQDFSKICTTQRPVTVCPNPIKPGGKPCSDLPKDVNFKQLENGYEQINPVCQKPFDDFSWQSFVALNWPLNDLSQPRPWEQYMDPYVVFNPPEIQKMKAAVAEQNQKVKILYRMAKLHPLPPEQSTGFLEATQQPLIDRNLNFALYEERVNPVWTNYVFTNRLSTVAGQKLFIAAKKQVKFPAGHYLDDQKGTGGKLGAMEVKATWRILDPKKDKIQNFYTRKADIYMDAKHTVNNKPLIVRGVLIGLVALHINTYTTDGKGSVWSTFEQEDNAPPQGNAEAGKTYSFFNPACTQCQLNTPPALIGKETQYLWGTTAPYAQRYAVAGQYGTQVTIVNPFYPETEDTNTAWHKLMPNTVWTHYRLIGTQWVNGEVPKPAGIPPVLANSTLETYVPQNQSSCISCHSGATLKPPPQPQADLSFLLGHAH